MNGKLCILISLALSLSGSSQLKTEDPAQSGGSLSISSTLALHDEYLLLFTTDGYVISSNISLWCNSSACPVLSSQIDNSNNITELADLWNGSRVLGLERVDASALIRNSFTQLDYLLLIQQDPEESSNAVSSDGEDGLKFMVVQLLTRRIVTFGNGRTLFGHFWRSVPCLANGALLDIVTSPDEPTTSYILCREKKVRGESPVTLLQATLDMNRFHYSNVLIANSLAAYSVSSVSSTESSLFALLNLSFAGKFVADLAITLLPAGLHLIVIENDNASSASLTVIRFDRLLWSGPLNETIKMKVPSLLGRPQDVFDGKTEKSIIDSAIFEWAQIVLILYTLAFLLGTFYLLLVGTETLSDYLHEGGKLFGEKKSEPVWTSKYDLLERPGSHFSGIPAAVVGALAPTDQR